MLSRKNYEVGSFRPSICKKSVKPNLKHESRNYKLNFVKTRSNLELAAAISRSFSGLTRTATLMLQGWSPAVGSVESDSVANDEAPKARRLKGDLLAGDLLARTDTALEWNPTPFPDWRLLGTAPNGFISII